MKLSKKLKRRIKKRVFTLLAVIATVLFTVALNKTTNFSQNLFKSAEIDGEEKEESSYSLQTNSENTLYSEISTYSNVTVEPKIVGGNSHFISLTAEGKVYGWGYNGNMQLATGNTESQKTPVYMGIDNAKDIASGGEFNVVLKQDGTVWAVGDNTYGQLGNNTTEKSASFVQVKGEKGEGYLNNIKSIVAGSNHVMAIAENGDVYGWGKNENGQLGIGNNTNTAVPVKTNFTSIAQIAAGENHTVAVDTNGTVWGVGYNYYGQLGQGNITASYNTPRQITTAGKEVACGNNHTMIVKTNGTVWATGYNGNSKSPSNRYAILGTGTGSTNGYNGKRSANGGTEYYLQTLRQVRVTNTSTTITDAEHIIAGGNTTYITSRTAGMYTIGINSYGNLFSGNTTTQTGGFTLKQQAGKKIEKVAVTKSGFTGAYVDTAGRIFTVGYSANGELGNGTTATSYGYITYDINDYRYDISENIINMQNGTTKSISANFSCNISLKNASLNLNENIQYESLDDQVVTIEGNTIKAVGIGTTYVRAYNYTYGIYGTVKVNVTPNNDIAFPKVVGGNNYFLTLKSDGTVWGWGVNTSGQLGLGDNINRNKPTKTTLTNVIDIAAGANFSAVLKQDGTVWVTGDNTYGQIGDNTNDNKNIFTKVENLTNVVAIAAENNTIHVLKTDGTVWSFRI